MKLSLKDIKTLEEKRAIDLTGKELAFLVAHQIQIKEIEIEFVGKEMKNKILCANSNTKGNDIIRWGRYNGYPIEKRGRSLYRKSDLERLCQVYWDSQS